MNEKAMTKKISVFGLGYVGTVLYGCLARDGHLVIGVDVDPQKLNLLQSGSAPVIEEGVEELCAKAYACGRATVTSDAQTAVQGSDISFVCVGTPSLPNGNQDLTAIKRVCEQIGRSIRDKDSFHVVVIRSTVVPGTVENIITPILEKESGKSIGHGIGICFQPEFLREGSSIKDYDSPPFTVIGGDSENSIGLVAELFSHLPAEVIRTDLKSAEMLKYCCNAFHALKITFANEVGRISHALGVDAKVVMEMVCSDTQLNISKAYLKPGFAFGGSCLPKDLKGLMYVAKEYDVEAPLLNSLLPSNTLHIEGAINKILGFGRKKVGLAGLSFKAGTDDLRESPSVRLAESLIGKGLELHVYDPQVKFSQLVGANKNFIEKTVPHIGALLTDDFESFYKETQVLVIVHYYPEIIEQIYNDCNDNKIIFDLTGKIDRGKVKGTFIELC